MAAAKKSDIPLLERSFSKDIDTLHVNDSNHGSNLLKGLSTMYKDGRYSDVTLKIGQDQKLQAHRVVLASFSPYFEALLGANWEDGKKDEIEILGLDESAVRDLIEFAYSANIGHHQRQCANLARGSELFGGRIR
ncbi:Kelch-like member 28 [Desmophyllum pertusum]|uniref:Kelch-like member 28 n=1 Tax=Desmophyllum pertusum TaxID=174260 RepID=A0A9W9ZTS1_9CNID|nr:Kelch-like member 28 [Desmophyllum pertusum]